jgi:N-methylhydantoinase A
MFHLGIDIGGTFTDCVLIGSNGEGGGTTYATTKALSTKDDLADGVMAGLAEMADRLGLSLPELLALRSGSGTAPRSARTPCWSAPAPESA